MGQPDETVGEVPFMPARVPLQNFTGVPSIVDLAAMRDAAMKYHDTCTPLLVLAGKELTVIAEPRTAVKSGSSRSGFSALQEELKNPPHRKVLAQSFLLSFDFTFQQHLAIGRNMRIIMIVFIEMAT